MTGSDVFFDTWAWWEVLHETKTGHRLWRTYATRVHTSVLTLSELSSKLGRMGHTHRAAKVLEHVAAESTIHPVTADDARAAGPLHVELRTRDPDAGLLDALILAGARQRNLPLISADAAFGGLEDVRRT